jgi:hypothetical protein
VRPAPPIPQVASPPTSPIRGAEGSGLRHNDKGKGNNLLDEPKIAPVSGDDRRTDLATGEGNQAIVHQAEASAEVESMAAL